jgi:hypothetical protein
MSECGDTQQGPSSKRCPFDRRADFEKFVVTIEYSVKWEGNASGDIPVFSFLTVTRELGGNLNSVHSVKHVFRKVPVTPSTWSGPTATPSP